MCRCECQGDSTDPSGMLDYMIGQDVVSAFINDRYGMITDVTFEEGEAVWHILYEDQPENSPAIQQQRHEFHVVDSEGKINT